MNPFRHWLMHVYYSKCRVIKLNEINVDYPVQAALSKEKNPLPHNTALYHDVKKKNFTFALSIAISISTII